MTDKRLYLCLRGYAEDDSYSDFMGGKIIVADNELEAIQLYQSYKDGDNDIYPDSNPPYKIKDITDKLQTSSVIYDNPCR